MRDLVEVRGGFVACRSRTEYLAANFVGVVNCLSALFRTAIAPMQMSCLKEKAADG